MFYVCCTTNQPSTTTCLYARAGVARYLYSHTYTRYSQKQSNTALTLAHAHNYSTQVTRLPHRGAGRVSGVRVRVNPNPPFTTTYIRARWHPPTNYNNIYIHALFTDGLYTKRTRAHAPRELIREWLWEPKGSSFESIRCSVRGVDAATVWLRYAPAVHTVPRVKTTAWVELPPSWSMSP